MELKANSFLAKYYKFVFKGKLPKDLCTLFWNTLISIMLFPIIILAALPMFKDEVWDNTSLLAKFCYGCMLWVSFIFCAAMGLEGLEKLDFVFWKTWFIPFQFIVGLVFAILGVIGFLLCICAVVLIVHGIKMGYDYFNKPKYDISNSTYEIPQESKTSIIWNTIRRKYCTKIDWK